MPQTIQYSNNPNSDTAFVVQDGGQKNRAVLTAEPAGTLTLSDSANVSTGYVTDEDGKKHKVNLVAQLEGDIEFSENPNSTKGYATVDGKKHRVVLTASLHGGGGGTPVIDELNVTPTTSAQTITAPSGTDGYSPVNVSAVDASIDANITSGNIKSGVSILGVSGNVVELNGTTTSVTPTTSAQTITPTAPSNGFTEVNVSAVTSAIDANIVAGNIKKDISILGVTGSYEGVAPSGTKSITTNGIHDVAGYASADVQVPTTAPAYYIEKAVDANGKLINGTSVIDLTGVTDVGDYALYGAYYHNSNITNKDISFPNLKKATGSNALGKLFEASVITSCSFPELESLTGNFVCYYLCSNCNSLTSFSCPKLTQIISSSSNVCAYILSDCGNLTSVNFDSLKKINAQNGFSYGFMRAIKLLNIRFPAFNSQTFGSYKNQFNYLLSGITGCTLHFPKNLDPQGGSTVISSLQGYPNFSGTNTVLAFDLPSTVLLTGANNIVYERSPKDDTATSLAWRKQDTGTAPNLTIDWTPFYTNTVNDPSVGGTIYSDSACTTAVTTISSIA